MINIGIAGIGFMGRIHFLAAKTLKGARVAAICSRDAAKRAGDWSQTRGNFGPPAGPVDLKGIATYDSFEAMLADPDLDLIDICTVTDQHADLAIRALKAGKHVLVEKPLSLNLEEARSVVAAAEAANQILMVAQVLPFFEEFGFVAAAIRGGKYGRLIGAHFTRVIARPDWSADIGDATKTGGPAIDLHIHDAHFVGLIAGMPQQVFATGVTENDVVTYLTTQYLYEPGGPVISSSSGAVAMAGRPFMHGYEVYLEHATFTHSSAGLPLTQITPDGKCETVSLSGSGDAVAAFTRELQCAVDGVRDGRTPDWLNGRLARDALLLCLREIESVKSGKSQAI